MNRQLSTDGSALAALLDATARGDREGFRALYEAAAPKLFGIVLRITRNRSMAEEVLQETFAKVWQNAGRYAPESGQPMAWLAVIARNCSIDRLRLERIERNRTGDDDQILERLAAPAEGDPALRQALGTCLKTLDEESRNCVVLAYCSGFSREELAERFGRPVGTIKTLLHRSLKQLRACLESE